MEPKDVRVLIPDVMPDYMVVNLTGPQGIKFAGGMAISNQIMGVCDH